MTTQFRLIVHSPKTFNMPSFHVPQTMTRLIRPALVIANLAYPNNLKAKSLKLINIEKTVLQRSEKNYHDI